MPVKRNSDMGVLNAYNPGTQYSYMHGPHENFGIFNGQFEQGPSGQDESEPPEGWIYEPLSAGGTFLRTTGGYAGNWCARGGRPGTGNGIDLISQKFIPVSTDYMYTFQLAAAHANNGTIRPGLACYTAAKVYISTLYPVAAFIPMTAYPVWTLYYYMIGPAPKTPMPAGTRYVRADIRMQANAALAAAYVYVDDVKFQQVQRWAWGLT